MLTLLIKSLDSSIHCLDDYVSHNHTLSPYEQRCLECIQQTISDLKICLRELQDVLGWCDEHEHAVRILSNGTQIIDMDADAACLAESEEH